jgi:hypothetical protein
VGPVFVSGVVTHGVIRVTMVIVIASCEEGGGAAVPASMGDLLARYTPVGFWRGAEICPVVLATGATDVGMGRTVGSAVAPAVTAEASEWFFLEFCWSYSFIKYN